MDDAVTALVLGGALHGARLRLSDPLPCLVLKPPSARLSGPCVYVRCGELEGHAVYAPPEMSVEKVKSLAQAETTLVRSPNSRLGLWHGKGSRRLAEGLSDTSRWG